MQLWSSPPSPPWAPLLWPCGEQLPTQLQAACRQPVPGGCQAAIYPGPGNGWTGCSRGCGLDEPCAACVCPVRVINISCKQPSERCKSLSATLPHAPPVPAPKPSHMTQSRWLSTGVCRYPLMISACGIVVCLLTTFIATDIRPARLVTEIESTLKYQLIISTVLATPVRPVCCSQVSGRAWVPTLLESQNLCGAPCWAWNVKARCCSLSGKLRLLLAQLLAPSSWPSYIHSQHHWPCSLAGGSMLSPVERSFQRVRDKLAEPCYSSRMVQTQTSPYPSLKSLSMPPVLAAGLLRHHLFPAQRVHRHLRGRP